MEYNIILRWLPLTVDSVGSDWWRNLRSLCIQTGEMDLLINAPRPLCITGIGSYIRDPDLRHHTVLRSDVTSLLRPRHTSPRLRACTAQQELMYYEPFFCFVFFRLINYLSRLFHSNALSTSQGRTP